MCVESVTASLWFIFVTQGKFKLFNSALLSMVVSNLIPLVILYVCTLSLYTYYGTTCIFYIYVLPECSYTDYVIITFIIVSVLVKVGQFPVLLYKFGVYLGLSTVQLGLYTVVYTNTRTLSGKINILVVITDSSLIYPYLSSKRLPSFFDMPPNRYIRNILSLGKGRIIPFAIKGKTFISQRGTLQRHLFFYWERKLRL